MTAVADHQGHRNGVHAASRSRQTIRAMAQAEAICRAHNVRLTPIRRKVLEELLASRRPQGAYEIAETLAPARKRIAPITVYRALDFLIQQGLAHKLASQNAYIASFHVDDGRELAAFLICESCGNVEEAPSTTLAVDLTSLLDRHGFMPRSRLLEIAGQCVHCQGRA